MKSKIALVFILLLSVTLNSATVMARELYWDEHRIELLDTIADRVMVMDAGEVISEGSLAKILADPKVHAAYFENVETGELA